MAWPQIATYTARQTLINWGTEAALTAFEATLAESPGRLISLHGKGTRTLPPDRGSPRSPRQRLQPDPGGSAVGQTRHVVAKTIGRAAQDHFQARRVAQKTVGIVVLIHDGHLLDPIRA